MAKPIISAFLLIGAASALDIATRRGVDGVEVVKARMEGARTDIAVQRGGCEELARLSREGRENEAEGPFNQGKYVPTGLLEAGIGEVMSQGLLSILASARESDDAVFDAALACKDALRGLLVQNDREKGLAMHRHSPHFWEATVAFVRRYSRRPQVEGDLCLFAGTYGTFPGSDEPAAALAEAGGVELLLDLLDQSHTDAGLMQRVLCAFSDNVQGSKRFADVMLSHNGVQRFVDDAWATHPMEHFREGNGFGLRYEVLEDIIGMMKHDGPDRKNARAFGAAGLMDVVIKLMPDEPGELYLQDHCCQVFNYLTNGDVEMQRKLAGSDGIKFVRDAVEMKCAPSCAWPPAVLGWRRELTNGTPPPSCRFTLANYEGGVPWKEAWSEARGHP